MVILTLAHVALGLILLYALYRLKTAYRTPQYVGKHIVITGASSGIGEAMAYIFSMLGATITICSNEAKEVLEFTQQSIVGECEGQVQVPRKSSHPRAGTDQPSRKCRPPSSTPQYVGQT
jgi:hypothetical protein